MTEIEVSKVKIPKNRHARPAVVVALSESIGEIGLLNPIILDDDNNVITGVHRVAAHKHLGLKMIAYRRSDLDDLGRALARIDENLCRNQMNALERAEALEERKLLWERLHPETKQGGAPGKKGGGKSKTATVAGFASDTAKKTGASERSVQQYTQVAKSLDEEAREAIRDTPAANSITDLVKLAQLPAEKQREVAQRIAKSGAEGKPFETVKAAARSLKRAQQVAEVRVYQPPIGEFAVIVADPAWPFEDSLQGGDGARGGLPYPQAEIEKICEMKIPAAADCVLWLWTTNTHLIDGSAAKVLEAWGFVGKTILTWDKGRIGVGRWLRNSTEHCILAVKGKPVVLGDSTPTLLQAAPGEHSEKPAEFFELVEKICPSPSRLELHARNERAGWITSGSELPKQGRANVVEEVEPPLAGIRKATAAEERAAAKAAAELPAPKRKRERLVIRDVPEVR